MDDLYTEVMSLLHDSGAFAKWQEDDRMSRLISKTRKAAEADMPHGALARADPPPHEPDQTASR